MRHFALLSALVLTNAIFAGAQETQNPTPTPDQIDTRAVDDLHKNTKAIYGRIKDVTDGQKIVIDVDRGRNRTYSLNDPKAVIRVADGLAVGDPVKVLDTKVKGNRTVDIVRNVEADSQHRARTVDANQTQQTDAEQRQEQPAQQQPHPQQQPERQQQQP
jgi:hypothetical protein